jgi:hypothetical protein
MGSHTVSHCHFLKDLQLIHSAGIETFGETFPFYCVTWYSIFSAWYGVVQVEVATMQSDNTIPYSYALLFSQYLKSAFPFIPSVY